MEAGEENMGKENLIKLIIVAEFLSQNVYGPYMRCVDIEKSTENSEHRFNRSKRTMKSTIYNMHIHGELHMYDGYVALSNEKVRFMFMCIILSKQD